MTTKNKALKPAQKAKLLGTAKLQESGLTCEDAKLLGMQFLTPQQTQKHHPNFKERPALKIPYVGPDGKPLADWHQAAPFYRLRYLEYGTDLKDLTTKKQNRYAQEPNTVPVTYYPQNFSDWLSLIEDPQQPLIITEGEFKAAKACKEGFPTIGIGGVYNWRSNKLGIEWLPSLEIIDWLRRDVYIIFDSDYKTNTKVCSALHTFAEELMYKGAFVYLVTLPSLPNLEKVGLDDFLVHNGVKGADLLEELLQEAEPLGLSKPLWEMNEHFVYIQNPGLIVNLKDMSNKISPAAFKDHLKSAVRYQERKLGPDGNVSYKPVSAAATWLKWPMRREASKLTYRPGAKLFTGQPAALNTWPGWGLTPKRGNVKPFLELVDHLFTGSENQAKNWFLHWCAYPLQNPGVKMFSSVVIHGIRQGTGKSLIGYTLAKIYGDNFTEINQMDLHNGFNEWADSKQFVMGDDVTGSNKRQDADFLKKMITQKELRINAKYMPSYVVPDCINYLFTSQHPDSFFLEDDDRRFFVHEVMVGPREPEFYSAYMRWLDEGGAKGVFYHLKNMNLGDFNPAAAAFKTAAKERMINTGRSDLASWVRQLLATPDKILAIDSIVDKKDLFTSKELLMYYDREGDTRTTANGLGRELSRAGVRQVCQGNPVKLADGTQGRYYIIRNPEFWETKPMKEAVAYLNKQQRSPSTERKKYRK